MSFTIASRVPVERRTRRRQLLAGLLVVGLTATLSLALGLKGEKQLSDFDDRVIISVPRTWTDDTTPQAGQWVDQGAGPWRVPDLEASPVLALPERFVSVSVEPRNRELARRHAAEVDSRCYSSACVDRGQPVAVEVNGRSGLEQVLSHAGAEWTVLLTLESENYLVTAAGQAGDLGAGPEDIDGLRDILRTLVLTR